MPTTYSSAAEELLNGLAGESETYRQLMLLTQSERGALQEHNLTRLAEIVRQKEAILANLMQGEKTRQELVTRLTQEIGLPDNASLSDIIAGLDGPLAQQLAQVRQELTDLVEQLLSLNHGNHLLIKSELEQVEATFNYLVSAVSNNEGHYSANGEGPRQATPGTVLNWEV